MKNFKRILASFVMLITLLAITSVGASAEWKSNTTGWWYTEGNSWATGWRNIDGNWYYFYSDGYMAHDTTIGGYYLNSSGAWTTSIPTATSYTSDGKQLGYVKKLYEESGSKYISIQYVQWLSGEEAIKAIMEDDKCTREEAQSRYTNDYYIRDKNKEVKKVKVSNNANYSIIKTGAEATKSNFDEVKKELGETTLGILCDVTIKDNEVTDLKQKYHP